jgi:hypothetical protein
MTKMPLINNNIVVQNLDPSEERFARVVDLVEKRYIRKSPNGTHAITSHYDFIHLYNLTKDLYQDFLPEVWCNYVPLYNTVWRQELLSHPQDDNIHQDESVYHFGSRGYQSRMINLWICLQKDFPLILSPQELGICVVESGLPENDAVYSKLIAAGAHFNMKRRGQLVDNTYLGRPTISFNPATLSRRSFPFSSGTAIRFSSHLLHATNWPKVDRVGKLNGFRTALTSVWVHRDDLQMDLLSMPEGKYQDVYMAHHDRKAREDLMKYFAEQCQALDRALKQICALARHHLNTYQGDKE